MHAWTLDTKVALRQLLKSPGFTLTALLMLALGIGATTAIFSIVEGVLLRPLPFPDSGRLVVLADKIAGVNRGWERRGRRHGAGYPHLSRATRIRLLRLAGLPSADMSFRGWMSRRR